MSASRSAGFAVPRTAVAPMAAEAFRHAEKTPPAFAAALVGAGEGAAPVAPEGLVAPHARLSVDVPAETLRKLKIRAIERRQTIREYVIALLARDGL